MEYEIWEKERELSAERELVAKFLWKKDRDMCIDALREEYFWMEFYTSNNDKNKCPICKGKIKEFQSSIPYPFPFFWGCSKCGIYGVRELKCQTTKR